MQQAGVLEQVNDEAAPSYRDRMSARRDARRSRGQDQGVLDEMDDLRNPYGNNFDNNIMPVDPSNNLDDGSVPGVSVDQPGVSDVAPLVSAPEAELPIDTSAQVDAPAETVDSALPLKELTEDQLVSGNLEKIFSEGGVLMDVARSAGDEYANTRGMLGSSMGAEASMRAMIDAALPIAQQDAQSQLSQLQFNQTAEIQQTRDSILQSYQLQMENLSTNNKAQLITLEQKYAAAIQSDKNASDVYRSTMDSIAQLMSTPGLSIDQQNAGMNELIGQLDAYLDFNTSLNSFNAVTGGTTDRDSLLEDKRADEAAIKNAKIAEYNQKKADLEENMPVFSGLGSLAAIAKWKEDISALDAEYQQWLR